MNLFFFVLACGFHNSPQKTSIQTSPPETVNETAVSTPIQTGLHDGIFTGYYSQGVLGEMKETCFRCRRGYSDAERSFIDRCTQAGGEVYTCACVDILCSEKIEPQ